MSWRVKMLELRKREPKLSFREMLEIIFKEIKETK
jgi:hypothetical protein